MHKTALGGIVDLILGEARSALDHLEEGQVGKLAEAVSRAQATFTTGRGRSGLIARCFAMRLLHVGVLSHAVGEATTPAIRPVDLLVAISRTGETPVTVALARQASQAGATVAAITASPESPLAAVCDLTVLLPDRPSADCSSAQYGGSLFEQTALIVLDAIALHLQRELGRTPGQMDARHANLE